MVPDWVEFFCMRCRGSRQASVFVMIPRDYETPRSWPTPEDLERREEEVLKKFRFEPRCRSHLASHQRPGIPYERGKELAWKALSEESRRAILVQRVMQS